jgi:dienelactone hydrolase
MRSSFFVLAAIGLMVSVPLQAEIRSEAVEYRDGDEAMQGFVYWDDAVEGKRPGILVVHEWWGLNEYAKRRAAMLAELGYVAFAVDMYGKGKVTSERDQAREWMQQVTADVEMWRERANYGIDYLRKHPLVDSKRIAAIGYCFGGGTVLQLAYGGTDIAGVVSFHGALPAAPEESKGKISTRILVLHGYADEFVKPDVVANFQARLEEAGARWEMDSYGGGVRHSFTNPDAAKSGMENLKYDAVADARSWQRMQNFFRELFPE